MCYLWDGIFLGLLCCFEENSSTYFVEVALFSKGESRYNHCIKTNDVKDVNRMMVQERIRTIRLLEKIAKQVGTEKTKDVITAIRNEGLKYGKK